jgi:hypothetical protein
LQVRSIATAMDFPEFIFHYFHFEEKQHCMFCSKNKLIAWLVIKFCGVQIKRACLANEVVSKVAGLVIEGAGVHGSSRNHQLHAALRVEGVVRLPLLPVDRVVVEV